MYEKDNSIDSCNGRLVVLYRLFEGGAVQCASGCHYDDVKALLGGYLRMYADPTSTTLQGTVVPYQENDFWTFLHLLTDDVDTDKYIQSSYGNNNKTLFVNTLDWKNSGNTGYHLADAVSEHRFFQHHIG